MSLRTTQSFAERIGPWSVTGYDRRLSGRGGTRRPPESVGRSAPPCRRRAAYLRSRARGPGPPSAEGPAPAGMGRATPPGTWKSWRPGRASRWVHGVLSRCPGGPDRSRLWRRAPRPMNEYRPQTVPPSGRPPQAVSISPGTGAQSRPTQVARRTVARGRGSPAVAASGTPRASVPGVLGAARRLWGETLPPRLGFGRQRAGPGVMHGEWSSTEMFRR